MRNIQNLNIGRVIKVALFLILTILIIDFFIRNFSDTSEKGKIKILGSFLSMDISSQKSNVELVQNPTQANNEDLPTIVYDGYSQINIQSNQFLADGTLTPISSTLKANDFYSGLVNIANFKNEYYSLRSETMYLNENAVTALNEMMLDYTNVNGKNNFIVYNSDCNYMGDDAIYSDNYSESVLGYSIDLAINSSSGSTIKYDGLDTEGWINQNCQNYGYIVRYPQEKTTSTGVEYSPYHLRYVGLPHAMIMNEANYSLEEYLDFLKGFSVETPYTYSLMGNSYKIYFIPVTGMETNVPVPLSGNYQISGNNFDGFIVTVTE